jgi:hypothetical protein
VLDPTSVGAGEMVKATGTGWVPGATITLSADFGGSRETIAAATVGDDSSFSGTFTVPDSASPADYHIAADDGAGMTAVAVLTVTQ